MGFPQKNQLHDPGFPPGFTLVELIVSIAIAGVIFAYATQAVLNLSKTRQTAQMVANFDVASKAFASHIVPIFESAGLSVQYLHLPVRVGGGSTAVCSTTAAGYLSEPCVAQLSATGSFIPVSASTNTGIENSMTPPGATIPLTELEFYRDEAFTLTTAPTYPGYTPLVQTSTPINLDPAVSQQGYYAVWPLFVPGTPSVTYPLPLFRNTKATEFVSTLFNPVPTASGGNYTFTDVAGDTTVLTLGGLVLMYDIANPKHYVFSVVNSSTPDPTFAASTVTIGALTPGLLTTPTGPTPPWGGNYYRYFPISGTSPAVGSVYVLNSDVWGQVTNPANAALNFNGTPAVAGGNFYPFASQVFSFYDPTNAIYAPYFGSPPNFNTLPAYYALPPALPSVAAQAASTIPPTALAPIPLVGFGMTPVDLVSIGAEQMTQATTPATMCMGQNNQKLTTGVCGRCVPPNVNSGAFPVNIFMEQFNVNGTHAITLYDQVCPADEVYIARQLGTLTISAFIFPH